MEGRYDMVIVGSGFASSFFLYAVLSRPDRPRSILVLERGPRRSHGERLRAGRVLDPEWRDAIENRTPEKKWYANLTLGGGSNCWAACTPRFLPSDFAIRTRYGVGFDWPLTYEDLEAYYCAAELLMQVSGDGAATPFPRSMAYPQPAHRFSVPDERMRAAWPETWFTQPCARPRVATERRPTCCANGTCPLCPIDAKFTVLSEMAWIWEAPGVTLETDTCVDELLVEGGRAVGVTLRGAAGAGEVRADRVVLAGGALFNPAILERSGFEHPLLGRRLHEQVGVTADVWLDGLDNFGGSTLITGHGYMLYDGPHRAERAACLIEHFNVPHLRPEAGRWRQRMQLRFIFEDLPSDESRVQADPMTPGRVIVTHAGRSAYALRGIASLASEIPRILGPLPVERWTLAELPEPTEYHAMGTTVMGREPATSVIDPAGRLHVSPNVIVLGSSAFPSCSPANPTLTICALALRAAEVAL